MESASQSSNLLKQHRTVLARLNNQGISVANFIVIFEFCGVFDVRLGPDAAFDP